MLMKVCASCSGFSVSKHVGVHAQNHVIPLKSIECHSSALATDPRMQSTCTGFRFIMMLSLQTIGVLTGVESAPTVTPDSSQQSHWEAYKTLNSVLYDGEP